MVTAMLYATSNKMCKTWFFDESWCDANGTGAKILLRFTAFNRRRSIWCFRDNDEKKLLIRRRIYFYARWDPCFFLKARKRLIIKKLIILYNLCLHLINFTLRKIASPTPLVFFDESRTIQQNTHFIIDERILA